MFLLWSAFVALILLLLAVDIGVLHRRPRALGFREAMGWSALWISLGLAFVAFIYPAYEHGWFGLDPGLGGRTASLEYLSAYLVEKSLSLDNIFVMAIIFSHFRIPAEYQHRVLFWGILGALIFRGAMIGVGLAALNTFGWTIYVLGALLLWTAVRMLRLDEEEIDPHDGPLVRLARRVLPLSRELDGSRFTVRVDGRLLFTPLALVLITIEVSDVLFAVDSIPAVFGVTRDPFIVFTSNVFAILGLRSLYFGLAGLLDRFRYIKLSLVVILGFVGVKMLLSHHVELDVTTSLAVISGALLAGILASIFAPSRQETKE